MTEDDLICESEQSGRTVGRLYGGRITCGSDELVHAIARTNGGGNTCESDESGRTVGGADGGRINNHVHPAHSHTPTTMSAHLAH
jgi:hypothetical protein